jgi:hypothetical protein
VTSLWKGSACLATYDWRQLYKTILVAHSHSYCICELSLWKYQLYTSFIHFCKRFLNIVRPFHNSVGSYFTVSWRSLYVCLTSPAVNKSAKFSIHRVQDYSLYDHANKHSSDVWLTPWQIIADYDLGGLDTRNSLVQEWTSRQIIKRISNGVGLGREKILGLNWFCNERRDWRVL